MSKEKVVSLDLRGGGKATRIRVNEPWPFGPDKQNLLAAIGQLQ